MIFIAYKSFLHIRMITQKQFVFVGVLFVVFTLFLFRTNYDFLTTKRIYFDIFLVIACCFLLCYFNALQQRTAVLLAAIFILQCLDLGANACISIRELQTHASTKADAYHRYLSATGPVIEEIKKEDASFYRMEKTFLRSQNDPMQFSYNGLSHFSSSEKDFVKTFLGKLGFRNNTNWAYYNSGSTAAADSLLGVKYLMTKEDPFEKPYAYIRRRNEIDVYQNPYALPVGFAVNSAVLGTPMDETDLFRLQNKMFQAMTGGTAPEIFERAQIKSISCQNVTADENNRVFQRIEAGKEASVVYTIQITCESPLYAYFPAPNLQGAEIFIGDRSLGAYFDVFRYDIVLLGKFPAGSTVSFTIKLLDDILQVDDALFYYENHTALQQNYEILSEGTGQFLKKSSSHLIATVDITKEDAYMLFTIPYEDGWRIIIDGNKAEKQKVFDTLIAVKISKGTHQIALKYTPKGFLCWRYYIRGRFEDHWDGCNSTKNKKTDKKENIISFFFAENSFDHIYFLC